MKTKEQIKYEIAGLEVLNKAYRQLISKWTDTDKIAKWEQAIETNEAKIEELKKLL